MLAWLLRLFFNFLIAEAHPAEVAGLWQLPFIFFARLLSIGAEHGFDAATGEFVERYSLASQSFVALAKTSTGN